MQPADAERPSAPTAISLDLRSACCLAPWGHLDLCGVDEAEVSLTSWEAETRL